MGKTRFSFSLNYGIKERPRNNIEMMNTAQKIQFEKEIFYDEPGYLFEPGRIMKLLRSASYGVMSQEEADAEIARRTNSTVSVCPAVRRRRNIIPL